MQMLIGSGAAASSASPVPSFSGTVTIDFTSYGPIPPIVVPPASEVFDISSLAGAGFKRSGG
jgi:hypothetical protein